MLGGGAAEPLRSSGDGSPAASAGPSLGGDGGSSAGYVEEYSAKEGGGGEFRDRSSAGNRWPREETLALLQIRSDMDVAFRESNLKGPLWEEVSRKLSEVGFCRSAKKCKEKFENVYKYHKRTKEGRAGKGDGKIYRFFDQLEALGGHCSSLPSLPPPPPPPRLPSSAAPAPAPPHAPALPVPPLAAPPPATAVPCDAPNIPLLPNPLPPPPPHPYPAPRRHATHPARPPIPAVPSRAFPSGLTTSSSSASSDETVEERGGRRRGKRKWKAFFERLLREVVDRQEEMQREFLEAFERREQDRMAREDAWKTQETARINREHEILIKERSVAAAKDAKLISILEKMSSSEKKQPHPGAGEENPAPQAAVPSHNPGPSYSTAASASRWPKAEIDALIRLRTELEVQYQEGGPKGPLWEEISGRMRGLGYCRSAKRCKEKWENINKYFKKVKEGHRHRAPDSKTCPYFPQLEALYRGKNRLEGPSPSSSAAAALPPDLPTMPLAVRPEQQWQPPPPLPFRQVGDNMVLNLEDDDGEDGGGGGDGDGVGGGDEGHTGW